jgi:hypothetical protein
MSCLKVHVCTRQSHKVQHEVNPGFAQRGIYESKYPARLVAWAVHSLLPQHESKQQAACNLPRSWRLNVAQSLWG